MHSTSNGHMIIKDIGDGARYGHRRLRSDRAASRPTNRYRRFIHRIGPPVTVQNPTDRSRSKASMTACIQGWGEARLVSCARNSFVKW